MTRPAFIAPTDTLSLINITVPTATDRDWRSGYTVTWDVVLPTITVATVLERAEDLIDEREDAKALRADPAQALDADLRDAFNQHDGVDEWRNSFQPMMDYAYPVELSSDVDIQTAVDLIDVYAGSVSLIERFDADGDHEGYEIALTGGGACLDADVARAYICCGAVPPLVILTRLGECGDNDKLQPFPMHDAYQRAFEWMDARHRDLTTQLYKIKHGDR